MAAKISEMVFLCGSGIYPALKGVKSITDINTAIIRRAISVVAFLVPVILFYFIAQYGITAPYMDQWALVPLLQKLHSGDLTISDLLAQHNEHRIFFPRVVMLLLAYMTDWNINYELLANCIFAGFILFFLYLILRRTTGAGPGSLSAAVLLFFVFSPNQAQNWIWGWQIQIFMSVMGFVGAVWSITRWPGMLRGVILAAFFSIISCFSFNNGLLTFPIIGSLLALKRDRKITHVALWITISFLVFLGYYYGYSKPAHHPSFSYLFDHPLVYLGYVSAYLGFPLAFGKQYIAIALGAVIPVSLGLIVWSKRSDKELSEKMLPWAGIALYSILSALATGIGRAGFGIGQAMSSRYGTISGLLTISAIIVFLIWISDYSRRHGEIKTRVTALISAAFMLIAIFYVSSFLHGINEMKNSNREIQSVSGSLECPDIASEQCLEKIYPDINTLRQRIGILYALGIFKKKDWEQYSSVGGGKMSIDTVNGHPYGTIAGKIEINIKKARILIISGWAFDDIKGNIGAGIYLNLTHGRTVILCA
jgi:hypothetical protein